VWSEVIPSFTSTTTCNVEVHLEMTFHGQALALLKKPHQQATTKTKTCIKTKFSMKERKRMEREYQWSISGYRQDERREGRNGDRFLRIRGCFHCCGTAMA